MTKILSNRDLNLYLRLLQHAQPFWRHLAGFFLLSLLASPLALLRSLPSFLSVEPSMDSLPAGVHTLLITM